MLPAMQVSNNTKSRLKSRAARLAESRPSLNRIASAADLSVVAVRELVRLGKEPHNRHVRAVFQKAVAAELSGAHVTADVGSG
jgi:hypothetical protein